mgnify:CR=1 FL=1
MVDLVRRSEPLDIGVVLQTTFAVIGRNFGTFLILSAILAGLPTLLAALSMLQFLGSDLTRASFNMDGAVRGGWAGLVELVTGVILQGAIIHITAADLNGQPASWTRGLSTGLRNILPLIAIAILYALGITFGLIFLIVPGILFGLANCVAVPVKVVEGAGVFRAFSRSAYLTRGNRWRILALGILMLFISMVLQTIGGALTLMVPGGMAVKSAMLSPITNMFSGMIGAALISSLYVELRKGRDGVGVAELASVFD